MNCNRTAFNRTDMKNIRSTIGSSRVESRIDLGVNTKCDGDRTNILCYTNDIYASWGKSYHTDNICKANNIRGDE
eukprot:12928235-Heterocapsa_arctica.AAC.1